MEISSYTGGQKMKIILSRKGFDSQYGGMPSPILPNGKLLSLPIPSDEGTTTYEDIVYDGKTYMEIMGELKPQRAEKMKGSCCHVDPDMENRYGDSGKDWKPAFGQAGGAQTQLKDICAGDIFLFYGWFRQTEYDENGKLKFVRGSKEDKHIIWGYMEVGKRITDEQQIKNEYNHHPHSLDKYTSQNNALYIPADKLSLDNTKKGYGVFNYAPIRQLTKENHNRSEWEIPDCFRDVKISHHNNKSYGFIDGKDYFKSACIGQEFILEATDEIVEWVKEVINA